ncbi:WYL domain-containing protein [Prosthecomicrobium hirschii]|uniref:WYL domain-containing protein n=1 Tax=Prosthecodimorpha hirschii TaxID=665126 RepID=UPI0022210DD9|nr:WYL domain-containing protein [Prosthecomicrobium hirschii]MCW1840471.1 WYL domain-containing protein [Prosthecomicrobium hirschii]
MHEGGEDIHSGDRAGLRWSVERRLDFVERRLVWEGRINRSDLVERFGVSPNQATADLKRFEAARPGALVYDTRARTYRAGPGLRSADAADTGDLLREFRLIAEGVMPASDGTLAAGPPLAVAEAPLRRVEPATLAAVVTAIRDRRELAAVYRSFTTPEPRRRRLEPHALVFDGFRWHARARDIGSDRFKDFVLGRLSEAALGARATGDPSRDLDWHQTVDLVIAPHPDLAPHQRAAVEADYGMTDGRRVLTCRRAVEYYVRRRLGLVPGHEGLKAADQHIVLVSSTARPGEAGN